MRLSIAMLALAAMVSASNARSPSENCAEEETSLLQLRHSPDECISVPEECDLNGNGQNVVAVLYVRSQMSTFPTARAIALTQQVPAFLCMNRAKAKNYPSAVRGPCA